MRSRPAPQESYEDDYDDGRPVSDSFDDDEPRPAPKPAEPELIEIKVKVKAIKFRHEDGFTVLRVQKGRETFGAAEAANPDGNELHGWFFGSACEREQDVATAPRRKRLGKGTGFGRSAEDENAGSAHV